MEAQVVEAVPAQRWGRQASGSILDGEDIYVKIVMSGPRRYVKLVEAHRYGRGISRQRVIATLGRSETIEVGGSQCPDCGAAAVPP
jgi:hypothetical protein